MSLKDSGERRQFETGAQRDMAEGKGDMYSLPAAFTCVDYEEKTDE